MKNIYILAMEYGNSNQAGFLYPDMRKWIELEIGRTLNQDMESALVEWFVESFSCTWLSLTHSNKEKIHYAYRFNQTTENLRLQFEKEKWVMSGHTNKQYVDYLELKESRMQAKRAFRTSIASIVIALASVGLSAFFFKTSPKPAYPPYEVKVIENLPSSMKYEKIIDSLKSKIHETNSIIDTIKKRDSS